MFLLRSRKWQSWQVVTLNWWLCGKTGDVWATRMCLYLSVSFSLSVTLSCCCHCIPALTLTAIHCSLPHTSTSKEQVTTKNTFTVLTSCISLWEENKVMTWHIFSHLEEGRHYRLMCSCLWSPMRSPSHAMRILFFSWRLQLEGLRPFMLQLQQISLL